MPWGHVMSTKMVESKRAAALATPELDALLTPVYTLPESEALQIYARLSPRLQWLARQRATGQRRASLIVHHAIASAQCR
jgi:hypothetical protein